MEDVFAHYSYLFSILCHTVYLGLEFIGIFLKILFLICLDFIYLYLFSLVSGFASVHLAQKNNLPKCQGYAKCIYIRYGH